MKLIKRNYEHYVNIDVPIDLNRYDNYNLHIVYFINCMINKNYMEWIVNHINIVVNQSDDINLIATIFKHEEENFRKKVTDLFPKIKIECYYENEYEYRGIKKAWELGQKFKEYNDIILYFHSKGITYTPNYSKVRDWGQNSVIKDYNKIKEIFDIFPTIDKIGYQTSPNGGIFINFWYTRGSYINNVEIPIISKNRFYYESWLQYFLDKSCVQEDQNNKKTYSFSVKNCYQFFSDKINIANIGSFFDSDNACYRNIMYPMEKF
jgi:hypothetical protein